MYKNYKINPPFFEIGPKAYLYGEKMLALAKVIDKVAMKYDLDETVKRFAGIVRTWDESHKLASAHGDDQKQLIEEIKIARATEILRRAKETEVKT